MKSSLSSTKSNTCVALTTKVLGDKWTPLLIAALLDGTLRFNELQSHVRGLNPRTLSARLDSLQNIGVVSKKVFPVVPPKVEYTLTQKGIDLYPILQKMEKWGDKYLTR